jgi:hypothetical protein
MRYNAIIDKGIQLDAFKYRNEKDYIHTEGVDINIKW